MVAILFEGVSDEEILNSILEEYELPREEVVFYNFEGKDKIFSISNKYYDEIESEIEVGRIEKILIIVDADSKKDLTPNRGFKNSKDKLEETVKKLNFNISVDYYIMCDKKKEGNLESFLLSILDEEQQECITKFRECYKYQLSDKSVYNTFYKQRKEPFNFNHENFNLLKEKLTKLFT